PQIYTLSLHDALPISRLVNLPGFDGDTQTFHSIDEPSAARHKALRHAKRFLVVFVEQRFRDCEVRGRNRQCARAIRREDRWTNEDRKSTRLNSSHSQI